MSFKVSGVLNIFFVNYMYHHMPYCIAVVDCNHGHHVVHYTNINTYLDLVKVVQENSNQTAERSSHFVQQRGEGLYMPNNFFPQLENRLVVAINYKFGVFWLRGKKG